MVIVSEVCWLSTMQWLEYNEGDGCSICTDRMGLSLGAGRPAGNPDIASVSSAAPSPVARVGTGQT
jgi:hypothetical protein